MSDGLNAREREPLTSLIGVRAAWRCCICRKKEITYQLVDAGNPGLDLPNGWRQRKGRTYCDCTAHVPAATNLVLKERTQ